MTTRTWNGSSGNFTDANSWNPAGVPASGDTAIIDAGTVAATGTISGVAIQLNQANGAGASTTLALDGATLDSASTLTVDNAQATIPAVPAVISVLGTSTLAGTGGFYGTETQFQIASGSTLVVTGTMNFYSSSPVTTGGGTLQNSGTLAFVNPNNQIQVPVLNDPITGTGTIALGEHARLDIVGAAGTGQTVVFNDGSSGSEGLEFDNPATFSGAINGFSASDTIDVANTPYTNFTYTSTGSDTGVLGLDDGSTQEASLTLIGQYTASDFSVTNSPLGGGGNVLMITTSVDNDVSAGLPPGYQNGGNGALPIYRFFDTTYGTHLFTQSLAEAQQILATRPDLTVETNDFGAVSQSNPSAEAVYRFFEPDGTHFFTASASEAQAIQTPGSSDYQGNFIAEPSSTFYEDSTQQAGDVAVFRFFDSVTGTQLLTGSSTEAASVGNPANTPGHNYVNEGIAFYAPTGTFTA